MLTLIFIILMFSVFGRLFGLAFKLTWGFAKICLLLIFFPAILIGIAIIVFIYISIFFLIIGGIMSLIAGVSR